MQLPQSHTRIWTDSYTNEFIHIAPLNYSDLRLDALPFIYIHINLRKFQPISEKCGVYAYIVVKIICLSF